MTGVQTCALSDLLAPILASKVVCVGKNYAAHAAEMGGEAPADPVIFLKPNTSVVGPEAAIAYPPSSERVDHEGELAVVIGQPCRDVAAARAHEVILGYTCANDVTARDQQLSDGQWTRGKGYDTFCPLGPWIVTDLDPNGLDVRTTVTHEDGTSELRQDGNTSQFMHTVGEIIEYVSRVMTLLPGDVILTGTPAGVGQVDEGDRIEVEVEGIVSLKTGGCPEDCHFCSQSGLFTSPVRSAWIDIPSLVEAAKQTAKTGATEFCIVAAVRGPDKRLLSQVAAGIEAIRNEVDIQIACSLGMLTAEQVDKARARIEAGEGPSVIARNLGVGRSTLYRALQRVEAGGRGRTSH